MGRLISFVLMTIAVVVVGPATVAWAHHGEVPEGVEMPASGPPPGGMNMTLLEASDLYGWEPLGIVAGDDVRRHTLGSDRWGVWVCDFPGAGIGVTVSGATNFLNSVVAPHYDWLSEGAYDMEFVAAGTVSADGPDDCITSAGNEDQPSDVNGGIMIADAQLGYGFGGPGYSCPGGTCGTIPETFPANSRYVFMGGESVVQSGGWPAPIASLVTHEIGHGIHWPHSFTGESEFSGTVWEYDNPIDLMSGNTDSGLFATETDSYATLAFNRYAAGWIDPSDVLVFDGGSEELVLNAVGSNGVEMIVVPLGTQGRFITLDARVSSGNDPFPSAWEGVSVHTVDQTDTGLCFSSMFDVCYGIERRTSQNPANPDTVDHVIGVGSSTSFSGVKVTVLDEEGGGFRVRVEGASDTGGSFTDTGGSAFTDDIEWLAGTGITRGCNPPTNDRFCPDDIVTRGQMAAFLVRALGLTDTGGLTFSDTGGTTFEGDVARLAAAGITKGCNPPTNDRFCPEDPVSRGQMAAFLTRAFGLTDGDVTFSDTRNTTFESDVARLATAGITKGCTDDRFCPDESVTRGQMAAFLHRAEGYLP